MGDNLKKEPQPNPCWQGKAQGNIKIKKEKRSQNRRWHPAENSGHKFSKQVSSTPNYRQSQREHEN